VGDECQAYDSDREADMAEKISKQEAVRRALAHFGRDAKPSQMKPWIKEQFGIDMGTDHISTAKGSILKAAGKGKPAAKASVAKTAPRAVQARKEASAPTTSGRAAGIPLQDILYVKGLVGRVGPDQLHTLIDAFAM
jgi:hypothetical protein